jgi:hypothetical protein
MVRGRAWVVRLGELVVILDLHRQGLSVSAIARQCGLDRKTVWRYHAGRHVRVDEAGIDPKDMSALTLQLDPCHIERGLEPPAYGPRPPQAK